MAAVESRRERAGASCGHVRRRGATVLPCEQCGGVLTLTDSYADTREGRFSNIYECVACGATGTIRGRAEAPVREWSHQGTAFESC